MKRFIILAFLSVCLLGCDAYYTRVLYGNTKRISETLSDYEETNYVLFSKQDDVRFSILRNTKTGELIARKYAGGSFNYYTFKTMNLEDLKKNEIMIERRSDLQTTLFGYEPPVLGPVKNNQNNNQTVNVFVTREKTEEEKRAEERARKIQELEDQLSKLKSE